MSHTQPPARPFPTPGVRLSLLIAASTALSASLVAVAIAHVLADADPSLLVARAAGITAYLLLVTLVLLGLVLAHPRRSTRVLWPSVAARIRIHVVLAVFTLVFTGLHVVMWATDQTAGVGWWGAFVPMGSRMRPVPVSLGVLGFWSGVVAGLSASVAGRVVGGVWWPIHKVAFVSLVLVWFHTLAGIDAPALIVLYVGTGLAVLALATSRHLHRHHRSTVADLAEVRAKSLERALHAPVETVRLPELIGSVPGSSRTTSDE
jgi:hypothetical protein